MAKYPHRRNAICYTLSSWSAVHKRQKCADPWKIKADALIRGIIMIICLCFAGTNIG